MKSLTQFDIKLKFDNKRIEVDIDHQADDHDCKGDGCCLVAADREASGTDLLAKKLINWALHY